MPRTARVKATFVAGNKPFVVQPRIELDRKDFGRVWDARDMFGMVWMLERHPECLGTFEELSADLPGGDERGDGRVGPLLGREAFLNSQQHFTRNTGPPGQGVGWRELLLWIA